MVGAGTMGFGIALNFALAGCAVILNDVSDDVLARSMRNAEASLMLMREERLITGGRAKKALGRIATTADLTLLAGESDFVTEAIVVTVTLPAASRHCTGPGRRRKRLCQN